MSIPDQRGIEKAANAAMMMGTSAFFMSGDLCRSGMLLVTLAVSVLSLMVRRYACPVNLGGLSHLRLGYVCSARDQGWPVRACRKTLEHDDLRVVRGRIPTRVSRRGDRPDGNASFSEHPRLRRDGEGLH